jgi:hypothetical protein
MLYVTFVKSFRLLMSDSLIPDCGNSTSNGGGPASDGNVGCNMACAGNASEFCGGPNRLDLYTFGDPQ